MLSASPVTVSIVSHGHAELVSQLLDDLDETCETPLEVILTLNISEAQPFEAGRFRFPLRIVRNDSPRGFGANHNAAFRLAKEGTEYFCVLNPDIRIKEDPFPALLAALVDQSVGVVAPLIVSPDGKVEDSIRKFPTPWSILRKALAGADGPDYVIGDSTLHPEWVAGMFMLFSAEVFRRIGGFDERYFLYYEDVDLCWRLRRNGHQVAAVPSVHAIHDARRESRRSFRHFRWHLASMLRFFRARLNP